MLELRQADLPGLHDLDAGRHALPGLRRAAASASTRCARCTSTRSATYVLIAINVLMFLGSGTGGSFLTGSGSGGSRVFVDFALWGPAIDLGDEYWRLITAGFLHSGPAPHRLQHVHPVLARDDARAVARPRALPGALLRVAARRLVRRAAAVEPNAVTVGASGAVFGLMGAAFVLQRARGIDPMQSGIGPVILFNLALSFVIPNISIGGHLGGLVGGALAAFAMEQLGRGRRGIALPIAACVRDRRWSPRSPASRSSGRGLPFAGLTFRRCPTTWSPSSRSRRARRTSTSGTRSSARSSSTGCCSPRSATRPTTASSATRSPPTATRSTR